jgi:DNA-binding response OmpR family regulator
MVNDDVSVSDMFCRTLRLDGYEVWNGFSAKEGLSLADKHHPHAIIVDLRMPLASVVEVVRNLRRLPGLDQASVALVTGDYYVDAAQADVLRSLGASVYYKPLWIEELVNIARTLIPTAVGP